MKREFRVTIDAPGNAPAEELLNMLQKIGQKAEHEHGITVDVERLETTDVGDLSFSTGAEHGD